MRQFGRGATTLLLAGLALASDARPLSGQDGVLPLAGREATLLNQVTGYTRAARLLTVAAETSGRLLELNVEEGAVVPGSEEFVFARLECQAQELSLSVIEAELALNRENADYLAREQARVEGITSLVTEEELLRKRHAARSAELQIELTRARIGVARDAVRRCEVVAPAGLVVLRHHAQPGEFLQPGAPIALLADFRTVEVDLRLDELEIRALRKMETPVVELLDHPQLEPEERMVEVSSFRVFPDFDPASRKRRVELVLPGDALPEASGGLRISLSLRVPDPAGTWTIPAAYVESRYGETFVHGADGRLPVTVIRRDGDRVTILGDPRREFALDGSTQLSLPGE